jgi:hypothetical protein
MSTDTPTPANLRERLKAYLIDALDPDDHRARAAAVELLDEIAQALSEATAAQALRASTTPTNNTAPHTEP